MFGLMIRLRLIHDNMVATNFVYFVLFNEWVWKWSCNGV